MKENTCVVCGSYSEKGLTILGSVICPHCERNIMTTDAGDAQYNAYIHKLLGVARKAARM